MLRVLTLSTLFPEVRLKQFLEMRGADMGDEAAVTALSALWTGLLYDSTALEAASELVDGWSAAERQAMRDTVPKLALATPSASQLYESQPLPQGGRSKKSEP